MPIHAGRAPFNEARSRLSTTARMAMPMRVRYRNTRRNTARPTATNTVMASCQLTITPNSVKPCPLKNTGATAVFCDHR